MSHVAPKIIHIGEQKCLNEWQDTFFPLQPQTSSACTEKKRVNNVTEK